MNQSFLSKSFQFAEEYHERSWALTHRELLQIPWAIMAAKVSELLQIPRRIMTTSIPSYFRYHGGSWPKSIPCSFSSKGGVIGPKRAQILQLPWGSWPQNTRSYVLQIWRGGSWHPNLPIYFRSEGWSLGQFSNSIWRNRIYSWSFSSTGHHPQSKAEMRNQK